MRKVHKSTGLIMVLFVCVASVCMAGADRVNYYIQELKVGKPSSAFIVSGSDSTLLEQLYGGTNASDTITEKTSGSGVTVDGVKMKDGGIMEASVASAVAVTNGQPVTLTGLVVRLNSSGGANLGTNTITLANLDPSLVGSVFWVINTGTSNNLAIAKTGTWMSPAIDLAVSNMVMIAAPVTNEFYGNRE